MQRPKKMPRAIIIIVIQPPLLLLMLFLSAGSHKIILIISRHVDNLLRNEGDLVRFPLYMARLL